MFSTVIIIFLVTHDEHYLGSPPKSHSEQINGPGLIMTNSPHSSASFIYALENIHDMLNASNLNNQKKCLSLPASSQQDSQYSSRITAV